MLLNEPACIKAVSQGPLFTSIQIERKLNNSVVTQVVSLRKNSRRVEFRTTIDWQESHKLLKVAFPVNIHTNECVNEIQFGHVKRPNHKSRPYDADRYEVCNHKWNKIKRLKILFILELRRVIDLSFDREWKHRVENWRTELKNHFYIPLGNIDFGGFITKDQMTVIDASKENFSPMPAGTRWGAKWEYGWFKGQLVLPDEALGKRIELKADVGGESAVYINGVNAGAKDRQHTEVTLSLCGIPGTKYEIMVESYAGHGPRESHAGPTPPGRLTVPEPGTAQVEVGRSTFGIWEEEVYQLYIDVDTLYHVRMNLDPNSLRAAEIDRGLKDFTLIVDYELPYKERIKTFKACRERLKPLLQCKNGSTAPIMYMFGHSHIDVAWLWPLAETERKCTRTFATQMALIEQYPEYRFLQSQPHLYWMIKNHYPELYERVKEKVKEGSFIPDGGMWVEADTNISGGESLIRQFIHGKKFFREEFGVESELLWLPDVFGYSGNMPQLMRGCGVKYFSTAKIFWAYGGNDPFPYNNFIWEGIDGSEVFTNLCNDYNSHTDPTSVIKRWRDRVQKNDISALLFPFGYGDGGGGATRDHLEYVRRIKDLEGVPKTKICEPVQYFKDIEADGLPENRYVGELYFASHRGTYTSQAKTKKGNRKSEFALREAEMWGASAKILKAYEYRYEEMDNAWKAVLLNQFHDIIPGSSIHRVYEEAEASYSDVIEKAEEVTADSIAALTDTEDGTSNADNTPISVFNSLSWNRKELVEIPVGFIPANNKGEVLPVQVVENKAYTEAELPSCGWTTVLPAGIGKDISNNLKVDEYLLENEVLRVSFNDKGEITSIFDKALGRELAADLCNSFKMYKDITNRYDAWDIDSMYDKLPVELGDTASIKVISSGPLFASIQINRKLNNSALTQVVSLRRNSRRVEFKTTIDWQESHKLLKVAFPVSIHSNECVNEIQFGHVRRPNHKSRPYDADRFEVCNHKWTALMEENRGFAILNDCKYGVNVLDNSIDLTLLKSALAPDMTADKGIQEFTYGFYAWNGSFFESDIIREAYEMNCPAVAVKGNANEKSLFSVNMPNIIIETVKPAEDGSNDIIVRMYESKRMAVKCVLHTELPAYGAEQSNMLEFREKDLEIKSGDISLEFRPFEIKTVKLKF